MTASDSDADLRSAMRRLISGFQLSQALFVAAALGIADALRGGAVDRDQLADRLNADEAALDRLMRALAENGVFRVTPNGRYAHTRLSELLISDAKNSLHSRALLVGQDFVWQSWGHLVDAVRTGEGVFETIFGSEFFDYLDHNPYDRAVFHAALAGGSVDRAQALDRIDLSTAAYCVDVGGGHGFLLAAALSRHQHLHGVLLDRAGVLAEADVVLAKFGVRNRCDLVAGSFFDAVPPGADVYLLSQVLHDWDDAHARHILRNCRDAMTEDSRLLIIERVTLTQNSAPRAGRLSDLNMLLLLGGQERTPDQYSALLSDAGLQVRATHQLDDCWGVTEAMRSEP